MQLADNVPGGGLAQARNEGMHCRGQACAQQWQGKGQRHPLVLEIAFARLGGMGQKQPPEHKTPRAPRLCSARWLSFSYSRSQLEKLALCERSEHASLLPCAY